MTDRGERAYFARMEGLLHREGRGTPQLLLDLDRVDANRTRLEEALDGRALRLVVKSLPALDLLQYLQADKPEPRFMVFHLPFLLQLVERFSTADVLMGKPLPVTALRNFYRCYRRDAGFDPAAQMNWLVDSLQRLEATSKLADELGVQVRVVLEIDIGMHRGGFDGLEAIRAALQVLDSPACPLFFAGFMGYDAHAAKAPTGSGGSRRAVVAASRHYSDAIALLRDEFPRLWREDLLFNGAGSPTYSLHDRASPLNDLSVGSALVQPSGFDIPSLSGNEAAAFIATPVLKRLPGVRIPFLEGLGPLYAQRDTVFIYGGKWMATPCWPAGVKTNRLYGNSSNQQMLTVPRASPIEVEQHVFMRPEQSEAVLLQFGDIWALRRGELQARWPVLQQEYGRR